MSDFEKYDVVFMDNGAYSAEGFTSGLLIFVKNLLSKFEDKKIRTAILSQSNSNENFSEIAEKHRIYRDSSIDIIEIRSHDASNLDTYEEVLKKIRPKIIFMNTPAVFLEESDIALRKIANSQCPQVIHILADELFPTSETHESDLVAELYKELAKGEVIGVTARIRNEFRKASGISSTPFKTIISTDKIEVRHRNPEYIGMVNIHPLKGVGIFNEVAMRLPEHDFKIVKNWPDVPEYRPSSSNVKVIDFLKKPADFYRDLKLLLIPSLMQEGPTMVIMEALYNGIPVIANKIGSIPEAGDNAALYIEPPSILRYDMEGTVMYPRCSQESFEKTVQEYCDGIESVLNNFDDTEANRLKNLAKQDIRAGHDIMDSLVNKWIRKFSI